MRNLVRMDVYRMVRSKSFWICLIIAAFLALATTPFEFGMTFLGNIFSPEKIAYEKEAPLYGIIGNPLRMLNVMIALLSACSFFYADLESGYIKNIAGQMPKRGYTVLSKFLAIAVHNAIFMAACVVANLLGTVFLQKLTTDDLMTGVLAFFLKYLLLLSVCSVMLLVTASLRSKTLGTIISVLLGLSFLSSLIYGAINNIPNKLLGLKDFDLNRYMPDQLLSREPKDLSALTAILSAAVTTAIFLPLSIRLFDRRDIK